VGAGFFMLSMIIEIVNDVKAEKAAKAAKANTLSEAVDEQEGTPCECEKESSDGISLEMPESEESLEERIEETEDKGNEDGREQNLS
jgi:hypothetical protein